MILRVSTVLILLNLNYRVHSETKIVQITKCPSSQDLCFGLPIGCSVKIESKCNLLVKVKEPSNPEHGLTVELLGSVSLARNWFAFGLSEDTSMGEDFVLYCSLINSTQVILGEALTSGHSGVTLVPAYSFSVTNSSSFKNGLVNCTWDFRVSGGARGRTFNLRSKIYYALIAYGPLTRSNLIEYHTESARTSNRIRLKSHASLLVETGLPGLVKTHSSFMIITWVWFISISVTLVRNYKDCWPTVRFWGHPAWYFFHRVLNTIAMVFSALGSLSILIYIGGFRWNNWHSILGTLAALFMFLNALGGLLRPPPDHKLRKFFNIGHALNGHLATVTAVSALFLSSNPSMGVRLPVFYTITMIVFVAFHIITQIILYFSRWFVESFGQGNSISPEVDDKTQIDTLIRDKVENFKFTVLIVYSVTVFLIGFVLIITVTAFGESF